MATERDADNDPSPMSVVEGMMWADSKLNSGEAVRWIRIASVPVDDVMRWAEQHDVDVVEHKLWDMDDRCEVMKEITAANFRAYLKDRGIKPADVLGRRRPTHVLLG